MSVERFDLIRKRVLVGGMVCTVPVIIATHLRPQSSAWSLGWTAFHVLVMIWLATHRGDAQRWRVLGPGVLTVVLAPLAVHLGPGAGNAELVTLLLVPPVTAMLFLDTFDLVVAVAFAGWLANTAFLASLGWPPADLVSSVGYFALVMAVTVFAAAGMEKLRELDRRAEAQHSQALRLSENRRSQSERLAIVGRLASGVAHEINNPLAFVKSNLSSLQQSTAAGEVLPREELEELLQDTRQGIERICQIVADLKGFSREDTGLVTPVDVGEVVRGAVRLAGVRLPHDAQVRVELAQGLPQVRASERKLAQVLLNLLVNAGDALEEGRVSTPVVTVAAALEGGHVVLSVTDNGPGITAEAHARLFEPFFTTKPPGKGTGLGLALSREYVESFGGSLTVQDAPGGGARFVLQLRPATPSVIGVAAVQARVG